MTTLMTLANLATFPDMRIHHATRAKAEKLQAMLAAEYPALSLYAATDEGAVMGWTVVFLAETDEEQTVIEGPKVPDLATIMEVCEEEGLDPEAIAETEEDEPQTSGSVVPEHYRAQYRSASSNGQTCGDWLAEALVADTHSIDGFRVEDFTQILVNNAVDLNAPWGRLPESGQKGWIGRYRMNGRQVLEKSVALSGVYVDVLGNTITPPAAFVEGLRGKHAKWIAKQEKAAKAALGMDTSAAA